MGNEGNCFTYAFEFFGIPLSSVLRSQLCRGLGPEQLYGYFEVVQKLTDRDSLLLLPPGVQAVAVECEPEWGDDMIIGHMVVVKDSLPAGMIMNSWPQWNGRGEEEHILDAFSNEVFGPTGIVPAHCYACLRLKDNVTCEAGI